MNGDSQAVQSEDEAKGRLTCSCGATELSPLKFGGTHFKLQFPQEWTLLKMSGFEPNIWVCKSCRQIVFSMPEIEPLRDDVD